MNHANLWLVGGFFLALTAFQVPSVEAQQFKGFSKKLYGKALSKKESVVIYRDTKGKTRVGLIQDRKRTVLKTEFSKSTWVSNIMLIGDGIFFIADDKDWSVKYFWTVKNGGLHFAATNLSNNKILYSKGLRKTSIAYPFLKSPTPKGWWQAEREGKGDKITKDVFSFFSFIFSGVVVDQQTVLLAYEVNAQNITLKFMEGSQAFLYRLSQGEWKLEKSKLKGLPKAIPDLNGDGINEVVMIATSNIGAYTSESSELIWWDKMAGKFMDSGITAVTHIDAPPQAVKNGEYKNSLLKFDFKAKPFPLIIVKVNREKSNNIGKITKLGSSEEKYQWKPAKQSFLRIDGKQ